MHMHIAISSQFRHASNSGVRLMQDSSRGLLQHGKCLGSCKQAWLQGNEKMFLKIVAQINLFDFLGMGSETIFKFCRFARDI